MSSEPERMSDAEREALKLASEAANAWDSVEHGWFEEGWIAGRDWGREHPAE